MPHYLMHGEKERVEMDPGAVHDMITGLNLPISEVLSVMEVNTAALRQLWPGVYTKLLKHRTTMRVSYPCLTWSGKKRKNKQ